MSAPIDRALMAAEAIGELDTARMALDGLATLLDLPEVAHHDMPSFCHVAALLRLISARIENLGVVFETCAGGRGPGAND